MGEVYRAHDTRLDRDVAIKILHSHLSSDGRLRERFDREARAISRLSHPNVCTLYDIGHQDGTDYLVMEFLEGESLADALNRGPLPPQQVLRYGFEIADALDKAHRLGIVHRDLKPGNIMLTKSGAKVLDFGLAKYAREGPAENLDGATQQKPLTEEGAIVGTMQYMAPEQLEAKEADARTDIFALGTILYEMATGRRAFEAKSRASLIAAIMDRDPAPVSEIQPMAPQGLDHLVRRCLAKDPDDRLQSARDVALEISEVIDQRRSGERKPSPKASRRGTLYLAIAVASLVAIGALIAWLTTRGNRAAPAPRRIATVAVLPLANLGLDRSRDYLRLAVADEITTILSYNPALTVRPFSSSRRLNVDIDPQEAARKLNVTEIISGHLLEESGRLSITLEAIDIGENKLLWRDVFEVAATDLISMRKELAARIQGGLLPKLAPGGASRAASGPRNPEAYRLYLRAAALSSDPAPNKEGIALLQEAVHVDPTYAPAWAALGRRAYFDYTYADGGQPAYDLAQEGGRRALALDPDLVEAAARLIIMQTEAGETVAAYQRAAQLVKRRPESAEAHFVLAYVLRYGGALDEAARECNTALALDPGNFGFRSCALTFMLLRDYDRAMEFTRLDAGTLWSKNVNGMILLRQGRPESVQLLPAGSRRDLAAAVLRRAAPAEIEPIAAIVMREARGSDGEPYYFIAGELAAAKQTSEAIKLLREAIQRGYCSYPGIENEPLFASLRDTPEYRAVRESAMACRDRFLKERERP